MAWIWDSPPFVDEDDWRYVAEQAIAQLDERRDTLLAELHGDSTSGTSAPPETEEP